MIRTVCASLTVLFLCFFGAHSGKAAGSAAELYGKGREIESVAISPDGTRIAYLSAQDGVTGLVVQPLNGELGFMLPGPEVKLREVEWSGPNHVLLYASQTETEVFFASPLIEFWGVFSVDVRSRELVQLLGKNRNMDLQTSLAGVSAKKWDENGTVFMSARTRAGGRLDPTVGVAGYTRGRIDLYEVDGESGRGRRVARGGENTDLSVIKTNGTVERVS